MDKAFNSGKHALRTYKIEILLSVAFLFYIVLISYVSILRLNSMRSNYYDLGIMDQTVYNTSKGHFLELSNPSLLKNTSRLAIHFDPILAVFAPLYRVHPSPVILLIGQSVILALGSWAVYYICLSVTRSRVVSLLFALLYLGYYPMQNANLFDYHAVNFATTGLLFMYLFLVIQPLKKQIYNVIIGAAAFIISILSKENVPMATGCLAGLFLLKSPHKKLWMTILLVSIASFLVAVYFIIPHFNGHTATSLKYYDFGHPLLMVNRSLTVANMQYIILTLLPFGFFSLLSPLHFILVIPQLLANLLSSNANMSTLNYQYTALVTPFIVISAIHGYAVLQAKLKNHKAVVWFILIAVFLVGMFSNYLYGDLSKSFYSVNGDDLSAVLKWQSKLKDDSLTVSTSGTIAPFFTQRRYFIDFLFDPAYEETNISETAIRQQVDKYEKAKYVLIYKPDIDEKPLVQYYYQHLKDNANFKLVEETNNLVVYKK